MKPNAEQRKWLKVYLSRGWKVLEVIPRAYSINNIVSYSVTGCRTDYLVFPHMDLVYSRAPDDSNTGVLIDGILCHIPSYSIRAPGSNKWKRIDAEVRTDTRNSGVAAGQWYTLIRVSHPVGKVSWYAVDKLIPLDTFSTTPKRKNKNASVRKKRG